MKESRHNSGTSLFLMEMILALLFLSLSSAACALRCADVAASGLIIIFCNGTS